LLKQEDKSEIGTVLSAGSWFISKRMIPKIIKAY